MTTALQSDASVSDVALRCITSSAIGDVDVPSSAIMHFPVPLGGFPDRHEFALLPAARTGLWWLQSTDDPDLTFILGDPFVLDVAYAIDLGITDRDMLQIEHETDAFTLVMLTLAPYAESATTGNFRAPLVFNLARGRGLQVVSRDDAHNVRRPVDVSAYPSQTHGLRIR